MTINRKAPAAGARNVTTIPGYGDDILLAACLRTITRERLIAWHATISYPCPMETHLPLKPPLSNPPRKKDPGRSNDEHGEVRTDELAADAVKAKSA